MNVWSRRGKSVVPYVWTANDYGFEHGAKPDGITDPRVTTYRIKPGALPGAAQYEAGQPVSIKLDLVPQIGEPWTITRLYPSDDFDWEALTGDDLTKTADCKTIGDLCQKLFALDPRKYVDHYYNFEKMSPKARHDVAKMLFEYWDNSAFRYEVSREGFDWSVLGEQKLGAPSVAAAKADLRLEWVLVKRPMPIVRSAAPGGGVQAISVPPAVVQPLQWHAGEIERDARRMNALLEQSNAYIKARAALAHDAEALRTLLQASASAKSENATEAVMLAGKARLVEDRINKQIREARLPEIMNLAKSAPPLALQAVMRRELGFVDDLAAAICACRDKLCAVLLDDDTLFTKHLTDWIAWVREHKQGSTPAVYALYTRLAGAVVDAIDALNETDIEDRYHDKIASVVTGVPDDPFTDPLKVGPTAAHKLSAVLGRTRSDEVWTWLGRGARFLANVIAPNVPNMVGNLAGPPSLAVAWQQVKAWRAMRKMIDVPIERWGDDYATRMKKFVDDTLTELDTKGSKVPDKLRQRFRAAMEGYDKAALKEMEREILDEFSGTYQASARWKCFGLFLQILAFASACAQLAGKDKPTWWDKGGVIALGLTTAVGIADTAFSVLGLADKFEKVARLARKLQGIGMVLGLVGGFIGAIQAAQDLKDSLGKNDALGIAAGGLALAGNLLSVIACAAWLFKVPIPEVNIAGIVLLAGAGLLTYIKDERERSKTAVSKVGAQLVTRIRDNAFYGVLLQAEGDACDSKTPEDGGLAGAVAAIEQACAEGHRPPPPNNDFVLKALADVGFDQETILALVDRSGAPIFPGAPMPG